MMKFFDSTQNKKVMGMRIHLQNTAVALLFITFLGFIPELLKAVQVQTTAQIHRVTLFEAQQNFYKADIEVEISVMLKEVTLDYALSHIADEAGLKLTYRGDILVDKQITLQRESMSVSEALEYVLEGTELDYKISRDGYLLIIQEYMTDNIEVYQHSVTGHVTDSETGESIPGVNIFIRGTTTGTVTDVDGNYTIDVAGSDAVLVISYVGYITQEIEVGDQNVINIELDQEVGLLDEVVVIGYGEIRRSDFTGSVSSIRSEEVRAIPSDNIMQALKGRAAGVQVRQNHGHPGGNISVRIRGTNSIVGNNEPLYIVDGFPVMDARSINNSSIESVEILKDASAVAIYGSRAANGVVMITTRGAREGATQVNFESSYGMQSPIKSMDMMNPREYAEFFNVKWRNELGPNSEPRFSQSELEEFSAMGEGTNWQDVIFQSAPIASNTIEVSGGTETTRFNVTGSAFNQNGIIENSDFNRYSLNTKISHDISSRVSVDANLTLSQSESRRQPSEQGRYGTSLIGGAYGVPNYVPVYDQNGELLEPIAINSNFSESLHNPLHFVRHDTRNESRENILGNVSLSIELLDGLHLNLAGGIERINSENTRYRSKNYYNAPDGLASINTGKSTSYLSENILNYTTTFGNRHHLSAIAGLTYQNTISTSLNVSGTGFMNDVTEHHNIGTASVFGTPGSSFSESTLLSGLSRVNYNYDDRYLLTGSFRADGSSIYAEGEKWGYFPSFAVAWRLSNEDFINLDNSIFSDIRIRASWGKAGSQAISPYSTMNRLQSGSAVFGTSLYTSMRQSTEMASDLRWETTESVNIGLELSILDGRVQFEADYYDKKTTDLLNAVQLAHSTGFRSAVRNIGSVGNKGFEFAVNSSPVLNENFFWYLDANISFNRSKVLSLHEGQDILDGYLDMRLFEDFANTYREGEPMGVFYGYQDAGYDQDGNLLYTTEPGDKVKIGDPNPNFIFGLNSSFGYRDLKLSLFLSGTQGNDIVNMSTFHYAYETHEEVNRIADLVGNYWTPANPNAKYPEPRAEGQHDYRFSERFVEDGSYIRLNNIELSYNFTNLLLAWVRNAEVYISGQNLITLTNYSWIDPDVNTRGGSNSLAQGIDYVSYPAARSVTGGIRLGF